MDILEGTTRGLPSAVKLGLGACVLAAVLSCQSAPAAEGATTDAVPRPPASRPSVEPVPPVPGLVARTFDHPRAGGTGAALGALHAGTPPTFEAWGRASVGATDPLAVDAVFPFSAMTGVLVGVVVRALDASGRLDAHAPVGELVPDLPPGLGRVTLDQLLRHTAGLDDARLPDGRALEEEVAALPDRALYAPPGVAYSVSKYSLPLAVRVLERHFQLPLADIVDRAVLEPLGLTRSTLDADAARPGMEVTGYTVPESSDVLEPVEPPSRTDGLPVLYTTVPELLTLFRAWLDGSIGGAGPATVLDASPGLPYRDFLVDGFRARSRGAVRELVVSDATLVRARRPDEREDAPGFRASARVVPETGTVIVSWSNASSGEVAFFPRRVVDLVLRELLGPTGPTTIQDQRDPGGSGEPITAWAGRYLNGERLVVLREPETDLGGAELAFWEGTREIPLEWGEDGELIGRLPNDGRIAIRFVPFVGSDGGRYLHDPAGRTYARQEDDGPGG